MSHLDMQRLNHAFRVGPPSMPWHGCDIRGCCSLLRPMSAVLTVFSLWGAALSVHAHLPAPLPLDPTVVHGSMTFDTVGDHMTVINSPNAILDWQSFSIDVNHGVHFQ